MLQAEYVQRGWRAKVIFTSFYAFKWFFSQEWASLFNKRMVCLAISTFFRFITESQGQLFQIIFFYIYFLHERSIGKCQCDDHEHVLIFPCLVATSIAHNAWLQGNKASKVLINLTWLSWPHWGKSRWSASCSLPGHSGKRSLLPCTGCRAERRPPSSPSPQTAEPVRDREDLCSVCRKAWVRPSKWTTWTKARDTARGANIFTQEVTRVSTPVWTGGICALTLGSTSQ